MQPISSPLHSADINIVEIIAIAKAFQISIEKKWPLNYPIVIESDSANAVHWCNQNALSMGSCIFSKQNSQVVEN